MTSTLTRVSISIALLLLSLGAFYYFYMPITEFQNISSIQGNNFISTPELRNVISSLDLDAKRFLQINPKHIEHFLEKRPLVKDVKIRSTVFPKRFFSMYITEEVPWAIYKGQIINNKGQVVVQSRTQAKIFNSPSVEKIYHDFYSQSIDSDLISIWSAYPLYDKDFELINKTSQKLSQDLKMLNLNQEEGKNLRIKKIDINREKNIFLITDDFEIKLGVFDKKIYERAKKFSLVVNKIESLNEKLAYVDLSLDSQEVILGK